LARTTDSYTERLYVILAHRKSSRHVDIHATVHATMHTTVHANVYTHEESCIS
jgi:hypothetical protein